jgi:hypothetical protein
MTTRTDITYIVYRHRPGDLWRATHHHGPPDRGDRRRRREAAERSQGDDSRGASPRSRRESVDAVTVITPQAVRIPQLII